MNSSLTKTCQEAIEYGIDINLIECNLELTPEQRIEEHQRALDTINELRKNFIKDNGINKESSQSPR